MDEQQIRKRLLEYAIDPEWERLSGGFNNRVYRAHRGEETVIIKLFNQDGMRAEERFLDYANKVAEGFVPRIVAREPDMRCIVLEDIAGDTYKHSGEIGDVEIERAIMFMKLLNSEEGVHEAKDLGLAKEGFSLVSEHMECVEARLRRLTAKTVDLAVREDVRLLIEEIKVRYRIIRRKALDRLSSGKTKDLKVESLTCISPGDFGFHNAIKTDAGAVFIDFEFAGIDDWTKCVTDFEMQPRLRVPNTARGLLDAIPVNIRNDFSERSSTLRMILWAKWLCIIMAFADPQRYERLSMLLPREAIMDEIKNRILSAERMLNDQSMVL